MFSGSLGLSVGGLAVFTTAFLEAPDMTMLGAHSGELLTTGPLQVSGTGSLESLCVVGSFNLFISLIKCGSSVEETEYIKGSKGGESSTNKHIY